MIMHPLQARFHDQVCAFASSQKQMIESLLSSVAKGIGGKSIEDITMSSANDNDEKYWGEPGSFLSFLRPYVVKNGILQIPVKGVLLHDFPYNFGNYATGYAYIWRCFERGLSDSAVKGIALIIHSPGGEVAGCFDLVDKMYARRNEKPIRAFAHEYAYSAAYALACVASKIVVSRTGGVGSIGVVTSHVSYEKAYERIGIEVTYIFAGKHKVDGNPFKSLSKEAKALIQARIDELYDVFVSTVARNRDMDEKAIRETEALTYTASQAVANGLADEVGTLDDATASFVADLSEEEDETMSTRTDEDVTNAETKGRETGKAEGKTEGLNEGAVAERKRFSGILACENAKTRPKAALALAEDTDLSVDAANKMLAKMPEEPKPGPTGRGNNGGRSDFARHMDQDRQPNAGSAGEAGEGDEEADEEGDTGADRANGPSRAERALTLAGYPTKKVA